MGGGSAAGELTLLSAFPSLCPHVPEPRLLRSVYLLSSLLLSCTSLPLSLHPWGAFFLCIWRSLFLPWVCVITSLRLCLSLSLSLSFSLSCLFVLILVSAPISISFTVYVSLFFCMSLSVFLCVSHLRALSLSPPCSTPPRPHLSPSLYISAFLALTFSPPACPLLPAPGLPPPPPVQGNVCGAIVLGDI